MSRHIQSAGFTPPRGRALGHERHTTILAELVTTVALALSTLIAATIVSIGVARADVATNVIDSEGSVFAIALLLGLLFIGMGGLTVLSMPHSKHRNRHS
ncbi:MAG TPA: hypothetical protein VH558_01245 [Pseudolabrys sp.]